jgi:hypothetical protein
MVKPLKEDVIKSEGLDEFAHFDLSCTCGSKVWHILGFMPEPKLILCPVVLECDNCNRQAEIFDIQKHGYDAELGHGCYSRRAEGKQLEFTCSDCNSRNFTATAVVSYQMDESEIEEEMKNRSQDLFDTFILTTSCSTCGATNSVCEYECA